jgi:hypothetical protein
MATSQEIIARHHEMRAYCESLPTSNWAEVWQAVQEKSPSPDFMEASRKTYPYGSIYNIMDEFYVVRYDLFETYPDPLLEHLAVLLGKGRPEKRSTTFEGIPAALAELGLPVDGWLI